MSEEHKATIRRLAEEVWGKGDLGVLDEIIHPEASSPHRPWALANGPAGFKKLVSMFRRSFPDLTRIVVDMVAEDDKVVLHYGLRGTHTGKGGLVHFYPTGDAWAISGVTAFRFVDGKIFEEPWAFNSVPAILQQFARSAVRRFIEEAHNKGNLDVVDEVFAVNCVSHTPAGGLHGPDEIKGPIAMRRSAFPDLKVIIEDQVAYDDKVVTRLTLKGTHVGTYQGIAPTGKKVSWSQIAIARFEGGKIVESWRIPDRQGLREQLGAD